MYETEAMTSCYRGILENETVTKIIYDIMLFMFRSKIDLLCLEERGIVSKMKRVLLRELLNFLCNIKECCLETK